MREAASSHFIHTNTARIRDARQSDIQPLLLRFYHSVPYPRQLDTSNKGFLYLNGLIVCQPRKKEEEAMGRNFDRRHGGGEGRRRVFPPLLPAKLHRLRQAAHPASSGRCFTNCVRTTDVPIPFQLPPIKKKA